MKKGLLLVLLIVVSISLKSQSSNENIGYIRNVTSLISEFEYNRLVKVNQLESEKKYLQIDSLFAQDEKTYFALISDGELAYASSFLEAMHNAYENIENLEDNLLFINAKKAAIFSDWEIVALNLSDLLGKFPDSDRREASENYQKLALFKLNKYQEFIDKFGNDPTFVNTQQRFQYAQALYNLGKYSQAETHLIETAKEEDFSLQSLLTLALISFAQGFETEAYDTLSKLEETYPPETSGYGNILLAKARLLSVMGLPEQAISYYQIASSTNSELGDDILFEIAVTDFQAGNLTRARKLFNSLIFSDDHSLSSLYNLCLIDFKLHPNYDPNSILDSYLQECDKYYEDLEKNRDLILEIQNLRNEFLTDISQAEKDNILEQIQTKSRTVLANQTMVDEDRSYLNQSTDNLIKELELKLIETNELYFLELKEIENYRNQPKDKLLRILSNDRLDAEDDYILGLTEELIKDIDQVTTNQFLQAYLYANQLYLHNKYIYSVTQILDNKYLKKVQKDKIDKLISEETKRLDQVKHQAFFHLSDIPRLDKKLSRLDILVIDYIKEENVQESKRKKLEKNYYDVIANRQEEKLLERFKELDQMLALYSNSFTKLDQLREKQHIFVDFINLDLDFRRIDYRYEKMLSSPIADSIGLSQASINHFKSLFADLYQRTQDFLIKNQNFENNDVLYFNLAEISSFINDDYQVTYDNYHKVVELNPDFPQLDVIYYNLAYYKSQLLDAEVSEIRISKMQENDYFYKSRPLEASKTVEKYKEVIDYYLQLINNYDSVYQVEAISRLANLYYDIAVDSDDPSKYISLSIKLYEQMEKLADDDQQIEAVYQRAWLHLAKQNYWTAISDLQEVLGKRAGMDAEQRIKYNSAEEMVVYSLNSIDFQADKNLPSAKYVADSLYSNFSLSIADKILNELLEEKNRIGLFEDVIGLYRAKSLVDEYSLENPLYSDSIIVTLRSYGQEIGSDSLNKRAENEYKYAVNRYGYKSDWYQFNQNKDLTPYVQPVQKGLDNYVIPEKYNQALQKPSLDKIAEFATLLEEYKNYQGFDQDLRQERLSLYDTNYISIIVKFVRENPNYTNYGYGISQIYDYIRRNPEHSNRPDLERNAYSWSYNKMLMADTTDFSSTVIDREEKVIAIKNEYLASADRYYEYLQNSWQENKEDILPSLLFYRGLTKYELGREEEAKEDFIASDKIATSGEFKESIYRNLAEIYNKAGDYDSAIENYEKAKMYAEASQQVEYDKAVYNNRRSKINDFLASPLLSDKKRAAQEMEIVSQMKFIENSESELLAENAISLYIAGRDFSTAINRLVALGDQKLNPDPAWENYGAAKMLAKDSLANISLARNIEDKFLQRFPTHKQTFNILMQRIRLLEDPNSESYNPQLASQKLRDIYSLASQNNNKLDISSLDLKPVDYYYNSVIILNKQQTKDEQVAEWVSFYEKFPNYDEIAVLNTICNLYKELNNNELYLKYIKILYQKDSQDIKYPTYALDQLKEIDQSVIKAYNQENWSEMIDRIHQYKKQANNFISAGISADLLAIPLTMSQHESLLARYEFIQAKQDYENELQDKYQKYLNFVNVAYNDRIKVNNYTSWNSHLKNKRLPSFDALVKEEFANIEADIQAISESQYFDTGDLRKQIYNFLYAQFKIAQYAGDLIYEQVSKFIELPQGQYQKFINSTDLRVDIDWDRKDEIIYNYQTDINQSLSAYVSDYDFISVDYARYIYDNYINGYKTSYPASQEILAHLSKFNTAEAISKESIVVSLKADTLASNSVFTQNLLLENDEYKVCSLDSDSQIKIKSNFNAPITPLGIRFRIIDDGDLLDKERLVFSIKVNDRSLDINNLYRPDGQITGIESQVFYRGLVFDDNYLSANLSAGNNSVEIFLQNISSDKLTAGFTAEVVYVQDDLELELNSQLISIVTDNTWLGADSLETLQISDPNWQQITFTGDVDNYYDLSAFNNTLAEPIWIDDKQDYLPEENNMLTQDEDNPSYSNYYFVKEFDLTGQVAEANLNFLANEIADIYINGNLVSNDQYYYFIPPVAPSIAIEADSFVVGKNTLLFVIQNPGQKKGLIVDLKLRIINKGE